VVAVAEVAVQGYGSGVQEEAGAGEVHTWRALPALSVVTSGGSDAAGRGWRNRERPHCGGTVAALWRPGACLWAGRRSGSAPQGGGRHTPCPTEA
jgi:hypothetical protein